MEWDNFLSPKSLEQYRQQGKESAICLNKKWDKKKKIWKPNMLRTKI